MVGLEIRDSGFFFFGVLGVWDGGCDCGGDCCCRWFCDCVYDSCDWGSDGVFFLVLVSRSIFWMDVVGLVVFLGVPFVFLNPCGRLLHLSVQ